MSLCAHAPIAMSTSTRFAYKFINSVYYNTKIHRKITKPTARRRDETNKRSRQWKCAGIETSLCFCFVCYVDNKIFNVQTERRRNKVKSENVRWASYFFLCSLIPSLMRLFGLRAFLFFFILFSSFVSHFLFVNFHFSFCYFSICFALLLFSNVVLSSTFALALTRHEFTSNILRNL